MPIDITPGSAGWWLSRLGAQLDADLPALRRLKEYDNGNHDLPQGHRRAREAFKRFQRQARANFAGLVTEAVLDRLQVEGFRMGGQGDLGSDARANEIWQANQMDADQFLVMHNALAMRRGYLTIGPTDVNETGILLSCEDPRQMMHSADPRNRRIIRAAMKTWVDDVTGVRMAVVYLPDTIHYFRANKSSTGFNAQTWEVDAFEGEDGEASNPLAPVVPVVPFINRPEKDPMGFGEFQDVMDIQDRINQTLLDRLTTGAAQAFRQRWATGIDLDKSTFDPGADLIWSVEEPGAAFGEFTAADLRQMIEATKADTEQLASISRTPPYYLMGQMANLSGDALTAAEAGLVAKAIRRMGQFGESWEAAMALAFRLDGREVAIDAETIWADPERRNEAASADAAVKKKSVDVPWRQLMEDLGYSPQQIDRMETLRTSDQLMTLLAPAQPQALEQPQSGQEQQPPPNQLPVA